MLAEDPGISLVLPVHNERPNLAPVLTEVEERLAGFPHEIVAVDDGSTDGSLEELERLSEHMPLRVVGLAVHTGQSAALAAGFEAARHSIVVTMDADGQYDPADILRLVAALRAAPACDAVVGYRERRADSLGKRIQSLVANRVRDRLTGDQVRDTGCSLKAIRLEALARLPRFDGMHRFITTLIRLSGGRVLELPVAHRPRKFGKSHYGIGRAFRGLRDAVGIRWLAASRLHYTLKQRRAR